MKIFILFLKIIYVNLLFVTYASAQNYSTNWLQRYVFTEGHLIHSISFIDSSFGWAAGWNQTAGIGPTGVILQTTNGGNAWSNQFSDSSYSWFNDITFLDHDYGWAVGLYTVWKTNNGGKLWTEVPDSLFHFDIYFGLPDMQSVSFKDTMNGIISGTEGSVAITNDGGKTWNCSNLMPENGFIDTLHQAVMLDVDLAVAVGFGGIAKTINDGDSWQITHTEWQNYIKCYFINPGVGWVLSRESQILQTIDTCQTWIDHGRIFQDYSISVTDLAFADSLKGWIIANNGTVWETVNGGISWQPQIVNQNIDLKSISATVPGYVFLVDETGIFYALDLQVSVNSNYIISAYPNSIELFQNFLNPFNPSTKINYRIFGTDADILTTLTIYDINGKEIITLVNEKKTEGLHTIIWKGVDRFGNKVNSGIYLCKIIAVNYTQTNKMIFIK